MTENEKIKQTADALKTFVDELGEDDIYREIFLQVFLEELAKNNLKDEIWLEFTSFASS